METDYDYLADLTILIVEVFVVSLAVAFVYFLNVTGSVLVSSFTTKGSRFSGLTDALYF